MAVTREKLDELYGIILNMACFLLEKSGEFFPICSVVKPDGVVTHLAVYDGDEHPESAKVIGELENVLRNQAAADEILASAIAIDSRVTQKLPKTCQSMRSASASVQQTSAATSSSPTVLLLRVFFESSVR